MVCDIDVAVVGGGPVGLMLACELRLAGCKVVVFERRARRVEQSRALTIHGRTLEMLSLRGLAERFTSRGRPVPVGHFAVLDTRLDFSVFETKFPYTLFLPQAVTEQLLEERALELGVELHRGHVVEHLRQTADDVTIEGSHGDEPFRATARYAVGADGARSILRREAGIDFPGYPATRTLMLGDVVLGAPPAAPVLSTVNGAGCLLLAPLGDGIHHRIVLLDPDRSDTPLAEPVTLEELSNSTRKIVGADFELHDPIWLSRFADETRLASTYRKGRVFLAGDAAHIHMPAGGQGMNVGLQDAMNLGWKLASVINGHAPEALLDSYNHERRPVGERLYQNTLAQTALITALDPAGLALRQLFNGLLKLPDVNRMLADQLSGFGVVYPEPALAAPDGWTVAPGLTGHRLPDASLVLPDGSETTLYGLMHQGKGIHLHFDGPEAAKETPTPGWATVVRVKAAERLSSLQPFGSVLIRPDGYIELVRA